MNSLIYDYGNRNVAVGGTWHAPAAPKKSAFAKSVTSALRDSAKLPVETRPTHHIAEYVLSAGHAEIGFFKMKKKDVCPPLVKVLKTALGESAGSAWAALIQLDEQTWWFVGVIDNVVQPGTDIYGPYEQVWAAWHERAVLFDVDSRIYVNIEREDFTGAVLIDLATLIAEIPEKDWKRLVPKPNASALNPKSIIALLAITVIGGWMGWDEYNRHLEEQAMAARLVAQQSTETAKPVLPWREKPAASVFVHACDQALQKVNISNAGWTFAGATCSDTGLVADFERNQDWPDASDVIYQNPTAELTAGGKKATVRVALEKQSPSQNGKPISEQALYRLIHTALPAWIDSANVTPDASLNAGQLKGMKIILAGQMPADSSAAFLDAIPTFRTTTIHFKPDLSADIEGITYAN